MTVHVFTHDIWDIRPDRGNSAHSGETRKISTAKICLKCEIMVPEQETRIGPLLPQVQEPLDNATARWSSIDIIPSKDQPLSSVCQQHKQRRQTLVFTVYVGY